MTRPARRYVPSPSEPASMAAASCRTTSTGTRSGNRFGSCVMTHRMYWPVGRRDGRPHAAGSSAQDARLESQPDRERELEQRPRPSHLDPPELVDRDRVAIGAFLDAAGRLET